MEPIIKVRNLCKRFKDPARRGKWIEIIRGVNLDVELGQAAAIIGRPDAGKSTLLRCLSFLEEANEGTIEIDGVEIPAGQYSRERTLKIIELKAQVGIVFQSHNLILYMTALQNVAEGPIAVKKWPLERAIARAEEMLNWVGLPDKRDEYPRYLSGGQQQRIAIARARALEPKIMLLDEPTSALAPESVGEVVEMIEQLAREGMTMVLAISHEVHFVRDVAHRVIFMEDGRFVEDAPPAEMFANPQDERTRRFLAQAL
jgi:ABC-type polar amino acid transport system ATPase subunit